MSVRPSRSALSRLARDRRGAMALTVSQMFLGAISLGIGMFRGTEVYSAFHHETLVAHANYGSSKLASDHARSANVVVNDNVIMGAIMGPRFGVEADNITMDANAEIACPTCPHSSICHVCKQYGQNKPRAMAKLVWVRLKQKVLWGTLGKLSGDIDKLASMQAGSLVASDIQGIDSKVKLDFDDPSRSQEIWGGGNADVACKLSMKDTLPSPVTGHAFPILISPNLLEGLPKSLVQAMPQMICAVQGMMNGPNRNDKGELQYPEIKSVSEKTRNECRDLEQQMRCSVAAAKGDAGGAGCAEFDSPEMVDLTPNDLSGGFGWRWRRGEDGEPHGDIGRLQLPSTVQPYVDCQTASAAAPLRDASAGGYWYRTKDRQIVTCTFDRDKCQDEKLSKNTDDYLRDKLELPKVIQSVASMLGGSETRKPTQGGSNPANFCACTNAQRPVDDEVIRISDAVRTIASFGTAEPSQALRKQRQYTSCGRWYFPDRTGEFASTPRDEQPFVGAWKWAQATQCQGGGS